MTSSENEKKNPNNPSETTEHVSGDVESQVIDDSKRESETLEQQVKTKVDSDELKKQVEIERYWNNKLHTYEILEWTWLKEKMLRVLADPTFNNYPELKDLSPEQIKKYRSGFFYYLSRLFKHDSINNKDLILE